ncbi:MAG: hypothetical protein GX896_00390 [Clostridiales bacterium]|nr:hypothetical protein [Clostridiales bacterium]
MDLPLGFGMALSQNVTAMENFATLNPEQKQSIINNTRQIKSKNEMQNFVSNLSTPADFDIYNYDDSLK